MRDDEQIDSSSGRPQLASTNVTTAPAGFSAPSSSQDHDDRSWPPVRPPMYSQYFGLKEPPFDLTPNPRFLFLTPRQREALSNLQYALNTYKGFALLVGEAGTGKTTLLRTALTGLGNTVNRYVLVSNPTLARAEFYEYLAREFGLSEEARTSKTRFLTELQFDVESRYSLGGLTGLIIDEAQSLPDELLEEIRLLGNIETPTSKLLNIVLSGQPELAERLNQPGLRQLKQRVALRCELRALTLEETASYISGRIRIAGGSPPQIFTREGVIAIHNASAGIPRTINVLCDNALIGGFAAQVKPITPAIVREVCRDFDLAEPAAGPAVPRGAASVKPPASSTPPHPAAHAHPVERDGPRKAGLKQREMFGAIDSSRKRKYIFFAFLLFASGMGALMGQTHSQHSMSSGLELRGTNSWDTLQYQDKRQPERDQSPSARENVCKFVGVKLAIEEARPSTTVPISRGADL